MPGIGQGGSLARWVPLNTPTGVEPDGAGGVVIADSGNGRLVPVDADGVLRVVVADGAGQPIRLMTTPDGEIAFADGVTHRILQLSIRRTVSTRSVRIDFAPAVHGDVTGKLTLLTNDPAQPQWSIPYHGRGVSKWLDLSESEHDFGAVSGPTHWTLDVTSYRERRLTLLDVSTDNGAFRVIERPRRIESGESGAVIVEFHPPSVAVSAASCCCIPILPKRPTSPSPCVAGDERRAGSTWSRRRRESRCGRMKSCRFRAGR